MESLADPDTGARCVQPMMPMSDGVRGADIVGHAAATPSLTELPALGGKRR